MPLEIVSTSAHSVLWSFKALSVVVLQGDIPNHLLLPTPTLFASLFSQHSLRLYCGEIFQATLLHPTPLQGTEVKSRKPKLQPLNKNDFAQLDGDEGEGDD